MSSEQDQWQCWLNAAADDSIVKRVAAIYDELSQAIKDRQEAEGGPLCQASGRCCDFEKWGHRLYVTGLEIACFLSRLDQAPEESSRAASISLSQLSAHPLNEPCIYQVNGLCSVHEIRPLGCRIFFCDEASDDWQHAMYEKYLGMIKALHETQELPYAYMEWRAGVNACRGVMG